MRMLATSPLPRPTSLTRFQGRCCLESFPPVRMRNGSKQPAPQDCALFLQAREFGSVALTANVSSYDIAPLIPTGRAPFYGGT